MKSDSTTRNNLCNRLKRCKFPKFYQSILPILLIRSYSVFILLTSWLYPSLPHFIIYTISHGLTLLLIIYASIPPPLPPTAPTPEYYCTDCNLSVTVDTKHCNKCKRCVEHFDHHCLWLGVCIGRDNYRLFVGLCLWTIALCLYSIVYQCAVSLPHVPTGFRDEAFPRRVPKWAVWLIVISNIILDLLITIIVSQLMIFHAYLNYKGLSTYQFIMSKRVSPKPVSSTSINSISTAQINPVATHNKLLTNPNSISENNLVGPTSTRDALDSRFSNQNLGVKPIEPSKEIADSQRQGSLQKQPASPEQSPKLSGRDQPRSTLQNPLSKDSTINSPPTHPKGIAIHVGVKPSTTVHSRQPSEGEGSGQKKVSSRSSRPDHEMRDKELPSVSRRLTENFHGRENNEVSRTNVNAKAYEEEQIGTDNEAIDHKEMISGRKEAQHS